ncbi:MAG: carboxypeptidase regulatory-like domain-containing protein [Solirubrobacterales bacterium]
MGVRVQVSAAILGALLLCGTTPSMAQAPAVGSISGTVIDENGDPFAEVCVSADSKPRGHFGQARTDASGRYAIEGLAASSYEVSFSFGCAPGGERYLYEYWDNVHGFWEDPDPIGVVGGTRVSGIDARADLPASISGTVTRRDGSGLPGVCVYAKQLNSGRVAEARTDASGSYRLPDLLPRSHSLRFTDCDESLPQFIEEYFDGAEAEADADPVALAGGEARRIDVDLERVPTISGRVTYTSGTPMERACVQAYPYPKEGPGAGPIAMTDADGRYTIIKDLGYLRPSVTYKLSVWDCGYPPPNTRFSPQFWGGSTPDSATPVVLGTEENRGGIDFQIRPSGYFTGRALDPAGEGLASICVQAWNRLENLGIVAISGLDGSFRSRPIPEGEYVLKFRPCEGLPPGFPSSEGYAPEFWDDRPTEDTADWVTVLMNRPVDGLTVEMTAAGPDPCVVPNLEGRRLGKAKRRLLGANCGVGDVKRVKVDQREGRVLDSKPRGGAIRRYETNVDLAIAAR